MKSGRGGVEVEGEGEEEEKGKGAEGSGDKINGSDRQIQ